MKSLDKIYEIEDKIKVYMDNEDNLEEFQL
jgi:hypothetical protein